MSLPLKAPRFAFGVDDVLPVEALNRVVECANDARTHLGTEHRLSPVAGLHAVPVIPVAIALIHAVDGSWRDREIEMEVIWSAGAWDMEPRWGGSSGPYWRFSTRVDWYGARLDACGEDGGLAFGARVWRDVEDPRKGYLAPWDDHGAGFAGFLLQTNRTKLVLISVYGER